MKTPGTAPDESPSRRPDRSVAGDPASGTAPDPTATDGRDAVPGRVDRVDLAGLSIAGITRRRVGWVAAALLSVWIVVVFARQVGDAGAAASRAAQLATDNTALAAEVTALQHEVDLVVRPEYVAIAARGHQFGVGREVAFTLDPSVPSPVDGAPGSASARLGAHVEQQTPLESWLSLLFGPGH